MQRSPLKLTLGFVTSGFFACVYPDPTVLVISSSEGETSDEESPSEESGTTEESDTDSSEEAMEESETDTGDETEESETDTGGETGEPTPMGPDIDMTLAVNFMRESVRTETLNFAPNDCAIEEACVGGPGVRRLLRFATATPNVGPADFVVGSPFTDPDLFEWGECHGHDHFKDFAAYRLLSKEGQEVASGHKMSFALIDMIQVLEDAGERKYPFGLDGVQGITSGWADIYNSHLDCQWVDITGVPAGDYLLEVAINSEAAIDELNFENNTILIPVTLPEKDPPPPWLPEAWTCEPVHYGMADGCHCGCGAFDPDCKNPTSAACEFCSEEGSCAAEQDCMVIDPNNNPLCQ